VAPPPAALSGDGTLAEVMREERGPSVREKEIHKMNNKRQRLGIYTPSPCCFFFSVSVKLYTCYAVCNHERACSTVG
jgi:hypothetical protein